MSKGLKISLEPNPDGKYEIVEVCKYCDKQDPYFKEVPIIHNHVKNRCKMLTNCKYCHDLVEAPELKDHYLNHCTGEKLKQCVRCGEVFPWALYLKHNEEKAIPGLCSEVNPNKELRCVFCEENVLVPGLEVRECWKQHLLS